MKISEFKNKLSKDNISKVRGRFLSKDISKLRFLIVIFMFLKTVFFMNLIESSDADKFSFSNLNWKFWITYIAFITLIYSFGYLFSKNKQIIFNVLISFLYSIGLMLDLWYFRGNKDFYGLKNILYSGTFNPVGGSIINFKFIDLILFLDVLFILIFIVVKKISNTENRSFLKFSFTIRYSLIVIIISFISFDLFYLGGWGNYMVERGWTTVMSSRAPGPIGYHLVEVGKTTYKYMSFATDKEKEEINQWMDNNIEDTTEDEYSGISKGKNVIFLQLESLENFVLNKRVNGKEISPFLNKLTKEGLYFDNFYQQNNAGNSIDCDFMVNTSIYPLGEKITGLNYGECTYRKSLPRVLNNLQYTTITTHAEEKGEFNWTELHKNSFGVEKLWDISDYIYEETVGYGLSDRSFLSQISNKLENIREPFFIQIPTLSNHGPFKIDNKYRVLDLPKDIDESYLGGYFESVNYMDRQIEMFFENLEKKNLLDNTMIVMYGDHAGVHKYYNDEIKDLDYDGNWWKEYDNKIPLIIYDKNVKPKVISTHGGQVDIPPTVLYLLGVDKNIYEHDYMGRNLITSNKNLTVIKGNKLYGDIEKEDKEHLLEAYDIGEKIIKNNMWRNN